MLIGFVHGCSLVPDANTRRRAHQWQVQRNGRAMLHEGDNARIEATAVVRDFKRFGKFNADVGRV